MDKPPFQDILSTVIAADRLARKNLGKALSNENNKE
jgi:hypothetical protein